MAALSALILCYLSLCAVLRSGPPLSWKVRRHFFVFVSQLLRRAADSAFRKWSSGAVIVLKSVSSGKSLRILQDGSVRLLQSSFFFSFLIDSVFAFLFILICSSLS
jgi:hypothetical protein